MTTVSLPTSANLHMRLPLSLLSKLSSWGVVLCLLVLRSSAFLLLPKGAFTSFRREWLTARVDLFNSANATNEGPADQPQQYSPIPVMPSQALQQLALSQLELLASSLTTSGKSKVKSMALYLPQENVNTGQLEFLPAVRYPHPSSERIFIANEAESGVAPKLPRTLTTLPGFAHAASLLPGYPMVSSGSEAGVGVVEDVWCDVESRGGAALSVPLFSGSQTVGVLLVLPDVKLAGESVWSTEDRQKVAQAAKSLSLALIYGC